MADETRDIEAELKALGLRPIAGGMDDPPNDDPPGDPPSDPPADVDPPAPPAIDPEVARLREENARLAGRLEEVARPKPEPVKPKVYTPAEVEELFSNQQITDVQRIAYYSDRNYEARRAQERETAAREAPEHAAAQDLQEYIDKHPDLSNPDSELIGKVKVELGHLAARYGKDTTTKLTQLEAVRNVVGGHRLGGPVDNREFTRRRQLGSSGGGPAGDQGGGGKRDPLKDVPAAQIEHWTRAGYTREQMIAEAPFVRRVPRSGPQWARQA